ncbi:MAG: hypothetical protein IKP66_02505, partial [Lachnospiraceae bacterium]|nr:hypothetical protein [Lachnospiraceae bacterium]
LIYFIEELSKTLNLMKYDENRRVILETAFIRLASPETNFMESAVMARLDNLEKMQKEGVVYKVVDKKEVSGKEEGDKSTENTAKNTPKSREMKLTPATMDEIKKVTDNWKTLASSVGKIFRTIMMDSKPIPGNEKEAGFIEVQVNEKGTSFLKRFDNIKEIEETLSKNAENIIGKKIIFKLILSDDKKYVENVSWTLDSSKIGMEIGEE